MDYNKIRKNSAEFTGLIFFVCIKENDSMHVPEHGLTQGVQSRGRNSGRIILMNIRLFKKSTNKKIKN